MKLENIFEEKLNKEDLEKKKKRSKELEKILKKNYAETFIKSAEISKSDFSICCSIDLSESP